MRRHVAALLLTYAAAFAPTPPPRAPRQTKVYFFDKLAESIKGATDLLSGKSRMTEANTKGALRDIRRALLDADVSKVVVDDLVERVTKNALGGEVTEGVDPSQQFVKIVYDELKRAMGGDDEALMSGGDGEQSVRAELEYREDGQPTVFYFVGYKAPVRRRPRRNWPCGCSRRRAASRCWSRPTSTGPRPSSSSSS